MIKGWLTPKPIQERIQSLIQEKGLLEKKLIARNELVQELEKLNESNPGSQQVDIEINQGEIKVLNRRLDKVNQQIYELKGE